MNARERFKAICAFERVNDPFMWSVDSWNETFERWVGEGMPVKNLDNKKEVNALLIGCQEQNECIRPKGALTGMGKNNNPPWVVAIDPIFSPEIIRIDGDYIIRRDYDGSTVRRMKTHDYTIPQYLAYPVTDRASWLEFRKRLDPFSPGRWPAGWEIMTDDKTQFPLKAEHRGKPWSERDFPLGMNLLSLYGNPRNYMGVEALSFAIYDDPTLVEEMVEWQSYLALEMLKKVFAAGVTLDWVWIWEDMCFNKGSLVSPAWVKEVMVPRYRPVVDLLRANKVDALILDCDGNIDELVSIWVDIGINAVFPFECAAGMDARNYRKKFGKNLVILGNVDKRALAEGKSAIDGELEKVRELLSYGGYFPNADHQIPPDVSYENIRYFMNELRKLSAHPEARRTI